MLAKEVVFLLVLISLPLLTSWKMSYVEMLSNESFFLSKTKHINLNL